MKTFTNTQESQIKKALDSLMQVGTAHILLFDYTRIDYDAENSLTWWDIKACVPYSLQNTKTGKEYIDDKQYSIHVGIFSDRRRHVLTSLNLSQHK